jgi:rubrerythrin
VTNPEVKRLFAELREDEVEHERLVASELERLPPDPEASPEDYVDEPVAQ